MTDETKIKVGPIEFALGGMEQAGEDADFYSAQLNIAGEQILVNTALGPTTAIVAVWHEVLHAILHQAGYDDHDEGKIEALAFGVVSVLKENEILRMND